MTAAKHDFSSIINDFMGWYNAAPRGSRFTYWKGFLSIDREPEYAKDLNYLANRAYQLSQQNCIALVQKRLGERQFAYIAVKL